MILEASIHKFKGDFQKTEEWVAQFSKRTEIVKELIGGEILYYNGSSIEVVAPYRTYVNKEEG